MRVFNRRAKRDFEIFEKVEAGIQLTGNEVKSVREGRIHLEEAFVRIKDGQAWVFNATIHPYRFGKNNLEVGRPRKLLLHRSEILSLEQKTKQKRLTLVPIACYTKARRIKLEIGLVRGKREFEKKQALKKKDISREIERELKER